MRVLFLSSFFNLKNGNDNDSNDELKNSMWQEHEQSELPSFRQAACATRSWPGQIKPANQDREQHEKDNPPPWVRLSPLSF